MGVLLPVRGQIVEDSGCTCLGRLQINGANANQAAITSITYSVFDLSTRTPTTPISGHDAVSLTVSQVIWDTLQTDGRWTQDATGYNFRHEVAATAFPAGGHRYRIEYRITPTSGQLFVAAFEVDAFRVQGS